MRFMAVPTGHGEFVLTLGSDRFSLKMSHSHEEFHVHRVAPSHDLRHSLRRMSYSDQLSAYLNCIEHGLDAHLPAATTRPVRIHEAMHYAIEGGGKRLRPMLVLATAELFGSDDESALPAAVAIECVHTYSLVHDDLPCMDNDDLRRGRATTHKAFDEATALLTGDALLTHAFALLATSYATQPKLAHALIAELATTAGSQHLIGGQMEDLLAEKKSDATSDDLEFIHLNKTAAMIETSLVLGGLVGGADESNCATLRTAGRHLGLTFQIIDDILDATADTATLGKTAGKDAAVDKTTYVKLHGIDKAQEIANQHTQEAIKSLISLSGDTTFLVALTEAMTKRIK